MAGNKLILLDTLRQLSLEDELPNQAGDVADRVRACFLIVSSHSVDSCAAAERIGYDTMVDERSGTPAAVRGLSVPGADCLLIDIVEGLMGATKVPAEVSEWLGDVEHEDYMAALYALRGILHALQWSEHDARYPREYDAETAGRMIAKSLQQLKSYRETGEP